MKIYYIVQGEESAGPFSIEDLKIQKITRESLVWKEGYKDWTEASQVEELKQLFKTMPPPVPVKRKNAPPPVPKEKEVKEPEKDPVKIEPVQKQEEKEVVTAEPVQEPAEKQFAVVEPDLGSEFSEETPRPVSVFLTGAILSVLFILLQLVLKFLMPKLFAVIIAVGLAIGTWYCFRKFFVWRNDQAGIKHLNLIIGLFVIFGVVNIVMAAGGDSFSQSAAETVMQIGLIAALITALLAFIAFIRLMRIGNNHPESLGGIAITSMLFVPFYFLLATMFNSPLFTFLGSLMEDNPPVSQLVLMNLLYGGIFIVLPYIFLAIFFFKLQKSE